MEHFSSPVCVLGAGPAGTTTSLYLSRFGIPHLLVDRATFPRDKVCGESFDGRVERTLEDLLPDFRGELTHRNALATSRSYVIHLRGRPFPVRFPAESPAKLIIPRRALDPYLLEKATAGSFSQVLTGYKVDRWRETARGLRLEGRGFRIDTQLLVQASGAQNILNPANASDKENHLVIGRRYFTGVAGGKDHEITFHFFREPVRGCLMLCPLPEGRWNVEIGLSRKEYQRASISFSQLLDLIVAQDPNLRQRFAAARPLDKMKGTFMPRQFRPERCAGNRLLVVGSSAYSVHPATGLGVGNALTMAKLAAETARDCIRTGNFSHRATRAYAIAVRKRMRGITRFNRLAYLLQNHVHWLEAPLSWLLGTRPVAILLRRPDAVNTLFRRPWALLPRLRTSRSGKA